MTLSSGSAVSSARCPGVRACAAKYAITRRAIDGDSGVLLEDPHDLAAYGAAVRGLLDDPARAERIGHRARERVRAEFLSARSLLQYLDLVRTLAP